jgi:tRNA(Ile)-lysidine synthase
MNIVSTIPNDVYLACSGGLDSMVVLHFLRRSRRNVVCLYFNHGTEHGDAAQEFLTEQLKSDLIIGHIKSDVPKGRSKEDFWRQERYRFLDQYNDKMVITCHHLDDQIETFLQGVVHGRLDRMIKHKRGNYLRPFLMVPKSVMVDYADRHKIDYIEDPSNSDMRHTRNRVRCNIIPEMIKINPGLYKSMNNLFDYGVA